MPPGPDLDSHVASSLQPAQVSPPRKAKRKKYRKLPSVPDVDPRIVDQIGANVYKYHPWLRFAIFIGLASSLWAALLLLSFGFLSIF